MKIKNNLRKKLLFLVNVDWFFLSHRLPIAISAIEDGYDVFLLTKNTGKKEEISSFGIKFIDIPFERSGVNIFSEIKIISYIFYYYFKIKPNIVHHITLKPIIYGSIASKVLQIDLVVNAFSGLGYFFTNNRKSLLKSFFSNFLKFLNNRENTTHIFQNKDDLNELRKLGIINNKNKIFIIKGSGIDLNIYRESTIPLGDKLVIFFSSRMLWDKGVRELYEATQMLKKSYNHKISFLLAGMLDNNNKSGIPLDFLSNWHDGNYVNWIGYKDNILEFYNNSDIVVLPSYREGLPKSLIEASAVGRPIITTNAVGCKDCVIDGYNGFLISTHSSAELADALIKLIENRDLILLMGSNSRKIAENDYDINKVISKHLEIYKN